MYALLVIDVKRVAAVGGLDPFFPTSLGATHAHMRQLVAAKCLNERGVEVLLEQPWTMATLVMPTMMIGAGNADVNSRILAVHSLPACFHRLTVGQTVTLALIVAVSLKWYFRSHSFADSWEKVSSDDSDLDD